MGVDGRGEIFDAVEVEMSKRCDIIDVRMERSWAVEDDTQTLNLRGEQIWCQQGAFQFCYK